MCAIYVFIKSYIKVVWLKVYISNCILSVAIIMNTVYMGLIIFDKKAPSNIGIWIPLSNIAASIVVYYS
jgi:hypothetical protein